MSVKIKQIKRFLFLPAEKKHDHLSELSDDMIRVLLGYLPLEDQMNMATASKSINQYVNAVLDHNQLQARVSRLNRRMEILHKNLREQKDKVQEIRRLHSQPKTTVTTPILAGPFIALHCSGIAECFPMAGFFERRCIKKSNKHIEQLELVRAPNVERLGVAIERRKGNVHSTK